MRGGEPATDLCGEVCSVGTATEEPERHGGKYGGCYLPALSYATLGSANWRESRNCLNRANQRCSSPRLTATDRIGSEEKERSRVGFIALPG